jgi:hypothetical protein
MQMIDVITRLREISERSPEIAHAIENTTKLSAQRVAESVQINVSGTDAVLHQILRLAGMIGAETVDVSSDPMGPGMSPMHGPDTLDMPPMGADMGPEMDHEPMHDMGHAEPMDHDMGDDDMADIDLDLSGIDLEVDEADNAPYAASTEPDEVILAFDTAVPSGSDLHREKGTYPKVAGADNPMAMPSVYAR